MILSFHIYQVPNHTLQLSRHAYPHHKRDGEYIYIYIHIYIYICAAEREVQYLKQLKGKVVTIRLIDYMI